VQGIRKTICDAGTHAKTVTSLLILPSVLVTVLTLILRVYTYFSFVSETQVAIEASRIWRNFIFILRPEVAPYGY
jgi:hypothetical protein